MELAPDIPEFKTNKLSLISVFVELIWVAVPLNTRFPVMVKVSENVLLPAIVWLPVV